MYCTGFERLLFQIQVAKIDLHPSGVRSNDEINVFALAGRRAQSKKLLETPGLRYSHPKMSFVMNRSVSTCRYLPTYFI